MNHEVISSAKELAEMFVTLGISSEEAATCHHRKTARDNGWNRHGTMSMYRNHGCRCSPCRIANTDYQRTQREEKRQLFI